jgi:hypothetical protein
LFLLAAAAPAACNVSSAPGTTGGVDAAPAAAACPAALAVVNSDYTSTSVSVTTLDAAVLSASIVSSASTMVGTSAALSGDVVVPHDAPASGELVLIDRYPNGVLTWVDTKAAKVTAQLSVNTGFAANPHDYLEVAPGKAYVPRYETNMAPGAQPFDGGGDVLVVDTRKPAITGRIDLGGLGGGYLPRADRMTRVGDDAVVVLGRMGADFKTAGDGALVGIDPATDAVAWHVDIPGLAACGGLASSPSGRVLAVACSGLYADGATQYTRSGLVLYDTTQRPPVEKARFAVPAQLANAPLSGALAFASETEIVGVVYGDTTSGRGDAVFTVDTAGGAVKSLMTSAMPLALGDVFCRPGCAARCFVADAEQSVLVPWRVGEDGTMAMEPGVKVDTTTGLPPRALGAL